MPVLNALFGDRSPPKEVISSQSQQDLTEAANRQALGNLGSNQGDINRFSDILGNQRGSINDLGNSLQGYIKGLLGRPNNPMGDLSNIGDYLYGKINQNAINPVSQYLDKTQALRNSVTGINGGLDSTSERLRRAGIANQLQLQALNSVNSQLPSLLNLFGQNRHLQDITALGAPEQGLNFYNQAAARELAPIEARNMAVNAALQQALASAQAHKANVYGYNKKTNFFDRFDTGVHNLLSDAERVANLYGGIAGMGGGGGGGGGGGLQSLMGMFGGGQGGGGVGGSFGGGVGGISPSMAAQAYGQLYPQAQINPYINTPYQGIM